MDLRFVWDIAVAPDGQKIIFLSLANGIPALMTLDLRADAPRPVLVLSDRYLEMNEIVWSPDGTRWALTGFEFNPDTGTVIPVLYVLDAQTGEVISRKTVAGRPVWSLDGRYIAVTDFGPDASGMVRLRMLNADGDGLRQITLTGGEIISRANWRP